jgi:probable F420-dependent oxidoreductase
MTISISAYDMSAPEFLDLAAAADAAGFDAVWLGEHVVLPVDYASEHPTHGGADEQHHGGPIVQPDTELLDPWVALGAAAGSTRRLRLATGMYIVPLRHPLMTARAACTLHAASGGRFVLGLGAGWLREEFDVLGVPFAERARRFEETVEILRRAWAGGPFDYHGDHFSIRPVQLVSSPCAIPLVFGGNSDRALRRAALLGDGWFSSGTPNFDDARRLRDRLHAIRAEHGLTAPFRCYFRVEGFDPAVVEDYAKEGIDDLVFWADQLWPPGGREDKQAVLTRSAEALSLVGSDAIVGGGHGESRWLTS